MTNKFGAFIGAVIEFHGNVSLTKLCEFLETKTKTMWSLQKFYPVQPKKQKFFTDREHVWKQPHESTQTKFYWILIKQTLKFRSFEMRFFMKFLLNFK